MDGKHTDKTLDELADLFLTGTADPSTTGNAEAERRPRPVRSDPHAISDAVAQLDGPSPIRLTPKPAAGHLRRRANDHMDRAHQAVEDVIGQDVQQTATPASGRGAALNLVEAVFTANLPGFGAPWLTQYAHQLAQRHGPVAILHVDEDQIDLELVSTIDDTSLPDNTPHRPGSGAQAHGDEFLDHAYRLSQLKPQPVGTWLIHPVTSCTPSIKAMARQLPRWTILCGDDEAAAVSVLSLVNDLADDDARINQRQVGVMVMGSDQAEASAAQRRLNMMAAETLDIEIGLVGALRQMAPVTQRFLGSFAGVDKLWPSVRAFIETMRGELMPPEGTSSWETPATEEPADDGPLPDTAALLHQEQQADPTVQPIADVAPPAPSPADGPDLVRYLTGTVPLAARCPAMPEHQLGLDESGRLHLLGRCDSGDGDELAALRAAVMDLMQTGVWVRQHIELLQLTQRQCRFDANAPPVLHLFTNCAKPAATLAGGGTPLVKLHLLQYIELGDNHTWFCTELN